MRWGKKGKVPVQYAWVGRAGSLPPPPAPLAEPWGGEGWRAGSCLGILSREGGISGKQATSWNGRLFWQVNSAYYSRGWIRQIFTARYSGGSFWRIYLAGHFGTFIWRVFTVNETSKFKAKEEKKRKCTISESVDCIMSLYIASNIMLFCSRCKFYWTS